MNRLLSNISLIFGIAVASVAVSVLASYFTCKWHWFGRSGAIITMAGVILSVRPLIRKGFAEWLKSQNNTNFGNLVPTQEEIEEEKQLKLDAKASSVGVYMALVGTLIWAYGDLVGGLP